MKARTLLSFALSLIAIAAPAQQNRLNDRFRQLDENGDGKLSKAEAGRLPISAEADRDEDGLVTFRELVEHLQARQQTPGTGGEGEASEILSSGAPLADRAASAADYSESHGGTAMVVLERGERVFERYAGETTAETTHHIHSGTKGFWGPVVAAMIDDGLISSFDELASETLTEWKEHPRKKTITLRQLLQLNAGLAQDLENLQGHERPTLADDLYEHAIGLEAWFEPGERFAYGPSCYYALGAVLERKLLDREQTPLDYLKERILEPIGVEPGKWVHDNSGNPHVPNGAWITTTDWANYGQFLLRQGAWENEQIIPAELMQELVEPSEANPGHGLALWLNRPGGFPPARQNVEPVSDAEGGFLFLDGEPSLFAALGAGKNRLYILPSRNMVIARQTPGDTGNFEDSEFVRRILGELPSVSEHLDLPYGDHERQKLNLYRPAAAKAAPIMVYVHGGGWKRGDKKGTGEKVKFFRELGWVFVSINYRLLPEGAHPTNVEDVASALAWVHEHAVEYGGDPDRIFLMGHSAGAHLAALAAVSAEPLAKAGKDRSIVKGVIPLDTNAYNIPRLMNEGREFYGQVFGENPEVWQDASPISHIAEGVGIPPFLICYTRGMRVDLNAERPVQANGFAEALRATGIPATVVDATDRNHGEINAWFGTPDDEKVTGAAINFLEAILSNDSPADADSASTQKGEVIFEQDYVAGTRDAAGEFLGGTETMHLVAHEGMLFAGNGYWTDQPGEDPRPGAQILRKDGPDSEWQLDRNFPGAVRISAMKSVTFTLAPTGEPLESPVRFLIADAGLARSRSSGPLFCHVRDDASGAWMEGTISEEANRAFIRVFGQHRDAATGKEHVFAGTGAGEIYRGSYDPEIAGSIRWESEPEYSNPDFDSGPFKRCQGFCVANGKLYASVSPRLLERRDGPEPKWVEVFRWEPEERAGAGMRGITAVKAPDGEHEVILGSREQEGRILRIDPLDEYSVTEELRSHEFLDEELGHFRGGKLVAYNRFIPGSHPATGEPIHWLTVAGVKTDDARAAWLLMRNADASYEVVRVFDPSLDPHPSLVSTRTLEFAPWDEGEFYTGGYDGAANDRKNHNTAWIFRGSLPNR